jgi:hypothetical protein
VRPIDGQLEHHESVACFSSGCLFSHANWSFALHSLVALEFIRAVMLVVRAIDALKATLDIGVHVCMNVKGVHVSE